MTVKEAIHVAGLPTTWGIPGTQSIEVRESAVAVQRLERAGAVIIGKTNVATQLGDWQTFNPVYGTTNNPWDVARTPGGSSGGGAAALAAGFVSLELGSDLNGSLRIPAHCCGVFAHKPTFGLVPTRGFAPPGVPVLSVNKDVDFAVLGPMARGAADLALALDVIAGPDDADAIAYTLSLPPPRHARLRDFRVLMVDEHPLVALSSEVQAVMRNVADGLERSGCRVARGSALLPDLDTTARAFVHLLMAFFGADMPDADYQGIKAAVAHMPPSRSGCGRTARVGIEPSRVDRHGSRCGSASCINGARCSASGTWCCARYCRRRRSHTITATSTGAPSTSTALACRTSRNRSG